MNMSRNELKQIVGSLGHQFAGCICWFKAQQGVGDWILLYVTPWGHTFLTALIISGVTFDGHFPLAFTSPSVLHPYVCVARTYIPGHMHLGVTQEVSLTLWGGSNPYNILEPPKTRLDHFSSLFWSEDQS